MSKAKMDTFSIMFFVNINSLEYFLIQRRYLLSVNAITTLVNFFFKLKSNEPVCDISSLS